MIRLPNDFKDFLRLLNSKSVEYLLVGGYAVGYHGYPRATVDMDIWIAATRENAQRMADAVQEFFGGEIEGASSDAFLRKDCIVRMGFPPMRIEILTQISGARFEVCYPDRIVGDFDGLPVDVISLDWLKRNKKASGRNKDLADLDHLP
jgi:hypothetical protein